MRINKIVLNNFGSYEGEVCFDTQVNDDKNIVLIGGKNGAGKTTLFTAMKICLYGYMSMGYKNYNSYYTRAVIKLINNNAKIFRPTCSEVAMQIELSNRQGIDFYYLRRKWTLTDSLAESFIVTKNDVELSADETADFEKYILSLIPPELFNLYFFDGERVADFFLEDGGNIRIKDAFLTLCGYDTFDIMRRNFRRVSASNNTSSLSFDEYVASKDELSQERIRLSNLEEQLKECLDDLSSCEASIDAVEKDYHQKGGITEEEWNRKLEIIKSEEKKRETYNTALRQWANEIVPFLMLKEQLQCLSRQIDIENETLKYNYFCEVIESKEMSHLVEDNLEALKRAAFDLYGNNQDSILDLSQSQNVLLTSQIHHILSFDKDKIYEYKEAIKQSIDLTAKIRKELENSSILSVQEYMEKRAQLFEEKSKLLVIRAELEKKVVAQKDIVTAMQTRFNRAQAKLEEELKKESISDISARAIVMIDNLEQVLFRKQIEKVERTLKKALSKLIQKKNFIDDVFIDDDFNIHIYRMDNMPVETVLELLSSNSKDQLCTLLGEKAVDDIAMYAQSATTEEWVDFFENCHMQYVRLHVEIDKSAMSNGEKQIFIMALYYSLVSLDNHEIPFVIDTPFARIDKEHRINISKNFFRKLRGQVFILSTNEEINSTHVKLLEDKIASTYILENPDNERTTVVHDSYFEV